MSHYFDHAATTPMRPSAIAAWEEQTRYLGNPSSIHGAGRRARGVVEDSREMIASALGVAGSDVIFTSGGTEADNMAVLGIARARRSADPARRVVLTSPIEHHAVLDSVHWLASQGFEVVEFPVDERGVVDGEAAEEAIRANAGSLALVTCMWVNNETGSIQPVSALSRVCAEFSIPYHCDAVQASLLWDRREPGCLAMSAHKIGGPMGVGALILPRTTPIEPIGFGGGQERRLRSGTIPVPLVASFAQALSEMTNQREAETHRLTELSARLESILTSVNAQIIGQDRSPAITYALIDGCAGQDLVVLLDQKQIYVSTGAACTAGVPQPSHVLLAMGYTHEQARSGLRFSLGWTTSDEDLDALAAALPEAVARARGV